jgi:hypothetical protein
MPVDITADVDQASADALFRQMNRAVSELNKGVKNALQWTAINLMQSLAAQTRKAPKLRKIVKNPNPKAATDRRFARFGVMRFDRNGNEYFKPIYRTGEFGRVRFIDKKMFQVVYRSSSGKLISDRVGEQNELLSIKTDKRRVIGRSGLAGDAWKWAQRNIIRGGEGSPMGVAGAVGIQWSGPRDAPAITIDNRLRYIRDAMTPGALDTAMLKAADSMQFKIGQEIDKRLQAKTGAL